MATRTPFAQSRNQFQRDWGNYANSFEALPNQPGNILSASAFMILEAGDTAYSIEDTMRCRCINPGTVGGGDAQWRLEGMGTGAQTPDLALVMVGAGVTTRSPIGVIVSDAAGGVVARNFTPGSLVFLERMLRVGFATAITANAAAGQNLAQLQFALAVPRHFEVGVGFLGTAVATGRFLCGLMPAAGQQFFGAAEPSSEVSCVFLGADSGDANLQLMHNDAAGVCTKIDLGAAFARVANLTVQVRLRISPGQVRYSVRRLDAAGQAVGVIVADLPADSQTLTWAWEAHTDATGLNSAEIAALGFWSTLLDT